MSAFHSFDDPRSRTLEALVSLRVYTFSCHASPMSFAEAKREEAHTSKAGGVCPV